ncbi:MAG: FMN-binding protein [Rectinemataceae bacterium]|nr:FMN-binding protein [Rectinemataceae bacterium]
MLIGMVVPQGIGASEAVNALNPLFGALPAARFVPIEGWEKIRTAEFPLTKISGIFIGESSSGEKEGVVIHVITPGYGGDIALLVSFDMEGKLLRVPIIKHDETQCHVPGLKDGSFLGQFLGLGLTDKIRLMVGKSKEKVGDIDAMSGGTVTSRALADGIAEARIGFYLARSAGLLESDVRP